MNNLRNEPTHGDIQRGLGQVEGKQIEMGRQLDKLETTVSEGFKAVTEKLEKIEERESERKGAWKTLVIVAGIVAAFVGTAASVLFQKLFGGG